MRRKEPRHLADGEQAVQSRGILVTVLVVVAVVVLAILVRASGPTGRAQDGAPPSATRGRPTTTLPAPTTLRGLDGNQLAWGDFERDLGALTPQEGTAVRRVRGGVSGAWAAGLAATAASPAAVAARVAPAASSPTPGSVWLAALWVRAATPGVLAQVRLRETSGGRQVSADAGLLLLTDTRWHQIGASHRVAAAGSTLELEVRGLDVPIGQVLLVDRMELAPAP